MNPSSHRSAVRTPCLPKLAGLWLTLWLSAGAALAAPAAIERVREPIDEAQRVELPGHVHPSVARATDLGPAPRERRAERLTLILRPSAAQEADLAQLLQAQQTPRSPSYHHWLTPQAFAARFGVAAGDRRVVKSWLTRHGFTIDEEPAGGRSLVISGTFGALDDTFGVTMRTLRARGTVHMAATRNPTVPRALAGVVRGFASLHDFRREPQLVRSTVSPAYTNGSSHYLTTGDFAKIYDLAGIYSAGNTGSGRSIAVLGRSNIVAADITNFQTLVGLPAVAPQIVLNGPDPGLVTATSDELESDLDLEWAGGIAPGASLMFVVSKTTTLSDGIDLSAQYAVSNSIADIISLSYAACESTSDISSGTTLYEQLWQQAAAQGISVFVASGDAGAAGCDSASSASASRGLGVNLLCTSPYSTCVGGTQFSGDVSNPSAYWSSSNGTGNTSALGYIPEVVWNQGGSNGGSGLWSSGGGASLYFAKPAWQLATGVPSDGRRDVPDVSLAASSAHDGYLIYTSQGYSTSTLVGAGGTSAATPAMAGIAALVAARQGGRLGNVNPVLYGLSDLQAAGGAAVFHRITSGNNSVPGQTGFAATTTNPTYSQAAGLGSIDGALLIGHWTDYTGTTAGLTPRTVTLPASSFVGAATLSLPATTAWTASVSGGSWLSVTPPSGTGPAALTYAATANPGGARSATITANGQTLVVTQAAGSGGSGSLSLSSTTVAFGSDPLGSVTGAQRVLVSNTGGSALTLGALTLSGAGAGDYTLSGSCTSGLVLAAGASCYVDLRFTASATGARAASLSIGVSGGSAASVALSGTGTATVSGGDGPLPGWSLVGLALALIGVAGRRLRR